MTIGAVDVFAKDVSAAESTRVLQAVEGRLLGARTPGHIPALDGLRGIAVLLVLFCHGTQRPFHDACNDYFTSGIDKAYLSLARLSWTGVDLFFVLSGFLITGILFDAKGKQRFFTNFYARRTVRIFPLYYVCLVLYLLIFPHFGAWFNQGMGHLVASPVWYWLYLSNYAQGYWEDLGRTATTIIHVSWTLSIEEQFYLCWPLVVFLFGRKTLLKICVAMFFGSMALRAGFTAKHHIFWAMNFTPCRVDGLAIGAAIALIARGPLGLHSLVKYARVVAPASVVALAVLIVSMKRLGYSQGIGQSPGYAVGGTALFALLYGSLLVFAAAAADGSLMRKVFELPIFRIFGKYSYAVYLFHLPIMVLLAEHTLFSPVDHKVRNSNIPALILFYAVSWTAALAAAIVSWNVMEKHCLKLKKFFPMESHENAVART